MPGKEEWPLAVAAEKAVARLPEPPVSYDNLEGDDFRQLEDTLSFHIEEMAREDLCAGAATECFGFRCGN